MTEIRLSINGQEVGVRKGMNVLEAAQAAGIYIPTLLTTPLVRRNGNFIEATGEEALDLVASKLAGYKGDQFTSIASAKCTNEDNYVIQKFARAVLGTTQPLTQLPRYLSLRYAR